MSASTLVPTIIPAGGGRVTITLVESGSDEHESWEVYRVEATANAGYVFDHLEYTESYQDLWSGTTLTQDHTQTGYWFRYYETHSKDDWYHYGNYTLVSVTAYFTAQVVDPVITVSASPAAGGTVTGGGTYPRGTTCIVYPMANQGYYCVGWYENGNKVAPGNSYSFTVTGDRNLIARFHQRTNLLVNTYNRSSPVRLVYDPATNRLVADY